MKKFLLVVIGGCMLQSNLFAAWLCEELSQQGRRLSQGADSVGMRVVKPGVVCTRDGQHVGISTSHGELINHNMETIGRLTGDGKIWSIQTEEELVFDGDFKSAEERRSYIYKQVKKDSGRACDLNNGVGVEQAFVTYADKDGVVRRERIDLNDGTSRSASLNFDKLRKIGEAGGRVWSIDHNHPIVGCGSWPSNADAMAMKSVKNILGYGVDFYIADCRYVNGQGYEQWMTMISSADGKVYNVNANGRAVEAYIPVNCAVGDKGDDAYDPKTFDVRRKKKENDDEYKVNDVANVEVKQVNDVDASKVGSSAGIGIKGWCSCGSGSDSEGRGARSITVGVGLMNCPKSLPRYSYRFCLRCGKCRRPNLKFDMRVIVDNQLEMQIFATKALEKGLLTTSGYVNARKDVERKFINIPDGQIVFPGKCTCKDPDPIRDGFRNNYVCVVCGRCYVPVNNTVPLGPTARREYGLK